MSYIENYVDAQLENMVANGSIIEQEKAKILKEQVIKALRKDEINNAIMDLKNEFIESSTRFLESDVISALSSTIYLPDEQYDVKMQIIGGKNLKGEDITLNTAFCIASITKLVTLLLVLKLVEKGIVNINSFISDYLPKHDQIPKEFMIEYVLNMVGLFDTLRVIASKSSIDNPIRKPTKEETEAAINIIRTMHLKSGIQGDNIYDDKGFILLKEVITNIYNECMGINLDYEQIIHNELLEPLGLNRTIYNPSNDIQTAGNGNKLNLPHDPKARILGGISTHAGLFSTGNDLSRLAKKIMIEGFLNDHSINTILTKQFTDNMMRIRGKAGVYLKNSIIIEGVKYYVPHEYSNKTYAMQGWTGGVAIFDMQNKIHNSILVDAIPEHSNTKREGYLEEEQKHQQDIAYISLALMLINNFNKIYNQVEEINFNIKL